MGINLNCYFSTIYMLIINFNKIHDVENNFKKIKILFQTSLFLDFKRLF